MTIGGQVREAPLSGINQTSFAFGSIMFAYLFFITVRGDLGKWLGVLGLAGTTGAASTTAPASTSATAANNDAGNSLPTGNGGSGSNAQVASNTASADYYSSSDLPQLPTIGSTGGDYGIIV
jgi:hypothetical protein